MQASSQKKVSPFSPGQSTPSFYKQASREQALRQLTQGVSNTGDDDEGTFDSEHHSTLQSKHSPKHVRNLSGNPRRPLKPVFADTPSLLQLLRIAQTNKSGQAILSGVAQKLKLNK
jgi:hypothetical protein